MKTVLLYDITNDRVRKKVADACLDYALARIQYSAFFGEISANHLEELLQRIRRLIGKTEARVDIFPLCEKDLRLRRSLTSARLAPPPRPGRPPTQPAITAKVASPQSRRRAANATGDLHDRNADGQPGGE